MNNPVDWNFQRGLPHDRLHLPAIKAHSLEKLQKHNYYARMFATGMKNRWPQRAYVGLYAGAGRAQVFETGEVVETTALSVLRLPDPFTKYIFVDNDPQCVSALKARIAAIAPTSDIAALLGDVNRIREDIANALPRFDKKRGLLSFCFVDPFAVDLKFETIRTLGRYKMDFLVLLAVGVDARRNFRRYYADRSDSRIADLIDCPGWREEYERGHEGVVRFILRKFDEAMVRIGFQSAKPGHHHSLKVRGTGVMQYMLVLYSKDPLGQAFWERTLSGTDPQLGLGLWERGNNE